ncbi:MAG: hypothetical protein OJF58_004721 [Enhydrobacter sp.]|nr:MAG: hypothetical protein OJF58_004721 [Enhydrobacter sp.]
MSERFFGKGMPRDLRNVKLASIYPENDEFFQRCFNALLQTEAEFVQRLIDDQAAKGVAGSFVEFGIYQGAWIDRLFRMTESAGLTDRAIYGFDSFKGLSKPHDRFDVSFWKEGMYAASRAEVERNLNIAERPRIKLIEGYFKDSLVRKEAKAVGDVAFARIDCDIYEPAKECLEFLSKRLTHGSILVFDDWTHDYGVGEGRAFAEWIGTVPHLNFKFLFLGPWDHLHLRVLHRDKTDIF